jgi:hypothetical protein
MRIIALWLTLTALAQPRAPLPLTVEVLKDVEVMHANGYERKGKLYFDDVKQKPFRLRKGQRFVMVPAQNSRTHSLVHRRYVWSRNASRGTKELFAPASRETQC